MYDDETVRKQYADEARERWGDTGAYKESEQRTAGYTQSDRSELYRGMDAIMEGFSQLKQSSIAPDGEQARTQVERLREFITERMYACTDEILAGLGEMYVADARFAGNIDRHGAGTAAYTAECIRSYCRRKDA